jgi:hypothetical protein
MPGQNTRLAKSSGNVFISSNIASINIFPWQAQNNI